MEKDKIIKAEIERLLQASHIREVQFLMLLSNVKLVLKLEEKWRVCVNFHELNKVYLKDCYPYHE